MTEPQAVPPYKVFLWSLLGIAGVAILLWLGTLLYWKVRIDAMIVQWENYYRPNTAGTVPYPDTSFFHRAGCRCLPPLIEAINRSPFPGFQQDAMDRVLFILVGPGELSERQWAEHEDLSSRFNIYARGTEYERKDHLAEFNAWWATHRHEYHQAWRVWSDWCREP